MNSDLLAELLARQQVLILARDADGGFRPEGQIPKWFAVIAREAIAAGGAFEPASVFMFLEHFLPDAEKHWESGGAGELRSGIWTESAKHMDDIHLEATACRVAGKALLLVRRIETEFDQLHRALQRGRELSITHERLLAETNKKEILLHCIVHDLSGPLSGVTGALDILRNENLSSEARRFLELGRLGLRQQANFITDLLDSFRAEMGSKDEGVSDPNQAPDLIRCTREVIDTLKPAFTVRNVTCVLDVAKNIPARQRVVGEWNRLLRVLHNLLQNALRHSPANDSVNVSIVRVGAEMLVTVENGGRGIPPDVMPQLFQKFVRGRGNSGKAGLGLFFCRIAVEQWGGTIGCEVRDGGRTQFWFRLKAV
jgi:signal transduction histidine kinase